MRTHPRRRPATTGHRSGHRCGSEQTRAGYRATRPIGPGAAAEEPAAYAFDSSPAPGSTRIPAAQLGEPVVAPVEARGTAADLPLGLPILEEVPELASMLADLRASDRLSLRALLRLADALDPDAVRQVTGVTLEQWIGIAAAQSRMDRRFLLRTARLLVRFPALRAAARAEVLTFSQVRAMTLVVRGVRADLDDQVDALIAELAPALHGAEPDAITRSLRRAVDRWSASAPPDTAEDEPITPYLALQPRLDGSGGRISGEVDAAGLALLDAATAPDADQLQAAGGTGGARLSNLLRRLATATGLGALDASDGHPASGDDRAAGPPGAGGDPPVKLLVRMDLRTLLGHDDTPADLLTQLLGGRLRLDAPTARRLADAGGADIRGVVIHEQGQVVGVGRRHRAPPGWLADAVLTIHDTCTEPLCEQPARTCDLDHAIPWSAKHAAWNDDLDRSPHERRRVGDARELGGDTDIDNVGPLCAGTNRAAGREGWRVVPLGGGRRRWRHERSGLEVTTVPAGWRPPAHAHDPSRASTSDPPGTADPDPTLPF